MLLHIGLVNRHRFAGAVRGGVADVIEHPLQHRVQPPRPDVLDGGVDLGGDIGDGHNAFIGEVQVNALGSQQRLVLLDQAAFGLGEDAAEIFAAQRLEFNPDGQTALQFRQQIGRLGDVEGARGDEQHMVGFHRAVFR